MKYEIFYQTIKRTEIPNKFEIVTLYVSKYPSSPFNTVLGCHAMCNYSDKFYKDGLYQGLQNNTIPNTNTITNTILDKNC